MQVTDIRALPDDAQPALILAPASEILAGFPSPAQDYQTNEIDLNEHLMPNRVSTYIVRVRGNSMIRAGIFDGDEIIVDRSIRAENGHVVVAVLDGELTVKRLRATSDGITLSPENPRYPDIHIAELSELHVWGVVTRSLHYVHRS